MIFIIICVLTEYQSRSENEIDFHVQQAGASARRSLRGRARRFLALVAARRAQEEIARPNCEEVE
jgi:hypothetical protein